MKLGCECVRDVLLCLEEYPFLVQEESDMVERNDMLFEQIAEALPDYPQPEIMYTLLRLKEGGYINAEYRISEGVIFLFVVSDMTFAGHELLEKIRPETAWKKTLSVLKNVGSFGIDLLSSVSGSILAAEASRWMTGG